ncbi:hypothetical protein TRFO_08567 [Tritrichomonas foetus]|uniref:Uncharacterized protein n=1 Tax=Tritrichomonas foetus TaxID=1144522 RepID=A0A1J4JIP0_9EUKA|nr:hypothetical protein TRFO_08567 [Tritrichomonas foetus]|eukprot:OHS99018.1 hypothetical protein TRFO_08567 [Tritrichomonas foetus]
MLFSLFSTVFCVFRHREETGVELVDGNYVPFQPGYVAGKWCLMHRYEYVTLRGKGYVKVRWETEWWYGWFQHAWPNYDPINDSNTLLLVAEGDKYFQGLSVETCNNGPEYGYINKYYYVDGEITISNNERLPKTHFTGSYNIAITDIPWDEIDESQHKIVYDHEDGILEKRTYKFLSRGDYIEGPVLEVRSKNKGSEVFVRMPVAHNNEMSDQSSMNQWWHIEYVKTEKNLNYYYVKNIWSGLVLTADGEKLIQKTYKTKSKNQLWNIKHVSSLYYSFQNLGNSLFINHDLVKENTFLSKKQDYPAGYNQEFHVFGILDYEEKSPVPEGYFRIDCDNENLVCENGCKINGARHVSQTFYARISNGTLKFTKIKMKKAGLYAAKINYATNDDNQSLKVYVNSEFILEIDINNNANLVSVIHDMQCYTDGLHSGTGTIIDFNITLEKGINEIVFENQNVEHFDIDYLDLSNDPIIEAKGKISGGSIAAIIIVIILAIGGGVVGFLYYKKKKDSSDLSFSLFT